MLYYLLIVPYKLSKIHPLIIIISEIIPVKFTFSPNNTADIIDVATIPTALQVAYATPRFIVFSAFDKR